jgi:hypothetical protein
MHGILLLARMTGFLSDPEEKTDEACLVPTQVLTKDTHVLLGSMKNLPLLGEGLGVMLIFSSVLDWIKRL